MFRKLKPLARADSMERFETLIGPGTTVHGNLTLIDSVRIDGNMVQIDAQTKEEKETREAGGRMLRSERWHGSVSRAFTVSQDVDDTKATAKYEDGVLTLELPKKASAEHKRIQIQ